MVCVPGQMVLRIWVVQHGAFAMLNHESDNGVKCRLAMIDSGDNGLTVGKPSIYIRSHLKRSSVGLRGEGYYTITTECNG